MDSGDFDEELTGSEEVIKGTMSATNTLVLWHKLSPE